MLQFWIGNENAPIQSKRQIRETDLVVTLDKRRQIAEVDENKTPVSIRSKESDHPIGFIGFELKERGAERAKTITQRKDQPQGEESCSLGGRIR